MTSAGEQVLNSRVELVSPHELKQCEKPLPPVPPQGLIVKVKNTVCYSICCNKFEILSKLLH